MPMYAISITPIIQQLMGLARQVWYADDAAAGVVCCILGIGGLGCCHFGYHVNVAKTSLVVKQGYLAQAQRIFDGTGIQITSVGWPYLGAPIGSQDFIADYTQDRVSQWVQGLSHLSSFAATQPMLHLLFLCMAFCSN